MSVYFNSLKDAVVKQRYLDKISLVNNVDPYDCEESTFSRSLKLFPNITHGDISHYFIYTKSSYTTDQFRAFKTMDSYKYHKCGWVRDILVREFGENILVLGKVMHSQRINEEPLQPWFVAKRYGAIICGHCTCVAGLGEACSHLGAVMFAIEEAKFKEEDVSVTGVKAYWKGPQGKAAEIMTWNEVLKRYNKVKPSPTNEASTLTHEELLNVLRQVKDDAEVITPLMMVTEPFCDEIDNEEENPLVKLFSVDNESLTLDILRAKAEKLELRITPDDCKDIEELTREQSKSQAWFHHRIGRVTASKFKNACITPIDNPAISTIKSICYPYETRFTSKQTTYGCEHEQDALNIYHALAVSQHTNFRMCTVGLMLSPAYPQFGASPDAIISCDCCGHGCVEIKCPYCAKNSSVENILPKYIEKGVNYLQLKKQHPYFYQIQMQMAICHKEYCDFVIWSPNDIYLERVKFNAEFWKSTSEKATQFWKYVILPELLGKYYTSKLRPPSAPANTSSEPQPSTSSAVSMPSPKTWCICKRPDDGSRMIKCDNSRCIIQWFHMKCMGMKRSRKKWFCENCKK